MPRGVPVFRWTLEHAAGPVRALCFCPLASVPVRPARSVRCGLFPLRTGPCCLLGPAAAEALLLMPGRLRWPTALGLCRQPASSARPGAPGLLARLAREPAGTLRAPGPGEPGRLPARPIPAHRAPVRPARHRPAPGHRLRSRVTSRPRSPCRLRSRCAAGPVTGRCSPCPPGARFPAPRAPGPRAVNFPAHPARCIRSKSRRWSQWGRGRSLAAYREHLRPSRGLDGMKVLLPGNCLHQVPHIARYIVRHAGYHAEGTGPGHPDIWVPPTAL